MPNNTVNFALPYPADTDAPCDFAGQWCDFTGAINGVLTRFQTGIDRAVPVIPAALIRSSTTKSVQDGQAIPFDETVMDTAGMTNLDADPYNITITRPGRYTAGGYIEKDGNLINTQLGLLFRATNTGGAPPGQRSIEARWNELDRGAGPTYSLPVYQSIGFMREGSQVALVFTTGAAGIHAIFTAWMCLFWHSDTEVSV